MDAKYILGGGGGSDIAAVQATFEMAATSRGQRLWHSQSYGLQQGPAPLIETVVNNMICSGAPQQAKLANRKTKAKTMQRSPEQGNYRQVKDSDKDTNTDKERDFKKDSASAAGSSRRCAEEPEI